VIVHNIEILTLEKQHIFVYTKNILTVDPMLLKEYRENFGIKAADVDA
jgi:hypothetical protein